MTTTKFTGSYHSGSVSLSVSRTITCAEQDALRDIIDELQAGMSTRTRMLARTHMNKVLNDAKKEGYR